MVKKKVCFNCKKEVKEIAYWVDPKFYNIPDFYYFCDAYCSSQAYKILKNKRKKD